MHGEGKTRRVWEKLQRSGSQLEVIEAFRTFEPFSYVPNLDMLVQVFPYDYKLPSLPYLMRGPHDELKPLLLAQLGTGDWQTETWKAEPVRYRENRRATLWLTARARDATTGRVKERHFYAKVYEDKATGEHTYEVLRQLWERASDAEGASFTVGRPITYLSDLSTLLQEETSGTSLQSILLQEELDAIPVVRRVAAALADLHLDHHVVAPRCYSLQDDVTLLKRRAALLQHACPHLAQKIERLVGTVVSGLREAPLAPIHGDFKPEHILIDSDRLILLDLDSFTMADPMLDVARFLAFLTNAPLRFVLSQNRGWAAAQAFVEEYFAHVPPDWRDGLGLYYARAVFKMAAGVLRRRELGWHERIEVLIEETDKSLSGKIW
jgi:hypothetical protein